MSEAPFRLLLVDDDENEQLLLADLLREGYADYFELSWLPTYEEGREAILSGRYDVCLLDYRLGGRTGLELLAEVKSKADHTQVVLLTGVNDRGIDVTATRAGAADYLVKGEFTAAMLERTIRYAVERGRTLRALRKASDLEALDRVKSTFLTAMSHETRTPLNLIMGMADMLRDSGLRLEQVGYLETLRRASSDLLALINDILDFSTLDSGRLELQHVDFSLEQLVDQVVEVSAAKARTKGLMLAYRISPSAPSWVAGDPMKLRQVLANLLGNAIKFTATGEVVLTVDKRASGHTGEIEFAVQDTGPGIPPDKLQTIFDEFTQADGSLTRKHGGAGLGLSISRRLVRAMGGDLTVESSEGAGSLFRFHIKVGEGNADAERMPPIGRQLVGKRILLIDESSTSQAMFEEILTGWGAVCEAFLSPTEGLARLREISQSEQPYSLAILSTHFKKTESSGLAIQIKHVSSALPILGLSYNSSEHDLGGCTVVALKPLSRSRLHRMLSDVLNCGEQAVGEPGTEAGGKPAKILVVDDSSDNRDLVQIYLMSGPYQLTFEEDGKAAVDRFTQMEFDLILMDVQMPVMDGLAATRAIRLLERQSGRIPVPIIVVSANASFQDMEASSEAGCNLHLAKPLSKEDLLHVIEEYDRPVNGGASPRPALREPILIQIPAGLEELVPAYLVRRKKEVSEMRVLAANAQFGQVAKLAHNLKGSGTGYGFPDLTRIGAQLNLSATQGDRKALDSQINELSVYLERVQIASAGK